MFTLNKAWRAASDALARRTHVHSLEHGQLRFFYHNVSLEKVTSGAMLVVDGDVHIDEINSDATVIASGNIHVTKKLDHGGVAVAKGNVQVKEHWLGGSCVHLTGLPTEDLADGQECSGQILETVWGNALVPEHEKAALRKLSEISGRIEEITSKYLQPQYSPRNG